MTWWVRTQYRGDLNRSSFREEFQFFLVKIACTENRGSIATLKLLRGRQVCSADAHGPYMTLLFLNITLYSFAVYIQRFSSRNNIFNSPACKGQMDVANYSNSKDEIWDGAIEGITGVPGSDDTIYCKFQARHCLLRLGHSMCSRRRTVPHDFSGVKLCRLMFYHETHMSMADILGIYDSSANSQVVWKNLCTHAIFRQVIS